MSKRKFLTLDDRVKVLKLGDTGKSCRSIATEMGVGKTQIQGIMKRKREIMDEFDANANLELKRPRRGNKFEEINDLCVKWFNDATGRHINVSGPLLKEKALSFATDLGEDGFKASNEWLESFLKWNNIVFKTMSGERGAINHTVVDNWMEKIPSVCEGYDPADIFNMDETGLFFRDTTKSTFFKTGEDCAGGKRSKDRITVALCASMAGEKVTPLVIGKAKKPRCFSRVNVDRLPVLYRANKKAWMTGVLFVEWLQWFDRQMKGRTVLLFVDNAPSHASTQLKNVTVKFLPANTTALCQPMDQGIIQTLKLKYRRRQLQYVINQMDREPTKNGCELLKGISVLDAVYWIASSWKEVQFSTVIKCFAKCGFVKPVSLVSEPEPDSSSIPALGDDSDDEADNYPIAVHLMARQLFDCEFEELLDIDKQMVTCDTEPIDWERPAREIIDDNESDDDDDGQVEDIKPSCTINDCLGFTDQIKLFATYHGNEKILEMSMALNELITGMKFHGAKQKKISEFFVNQ